MSEFVPIWLVRANELKIWVEYALDWEHSPEFKETHQGAVNYAKRNYASVYSLRSRGVVLDTWYPETSQRTEKQRRNFNDLVKIKNTLDDMRINAYMYMVQLPRFTEDLIR